MGSKPLELSVRTSDPRPIFKQIMDGITLAIAQGALREGDRVPSVRALAMQLTVNPNTVAKAYAELSTLGVVEGKPGLGLFVSAPRQMLSKGERNKRLEEAVQRCINDLLPLHLSDQEIIEALRRNLLAMRRLPRTGGDA
jgi:GntR family transcriptional regulator